MKKKRAIGKRLLPCAAALVIAAAVFGTAIESNAAYYIGYDNINIRDDAYGNVLGNIPKDTVVEITETKEGSDGNTWSHVTYTVDGTEKEGWVRSDLILGEADETQSVEETDDGTSDETEEETGEDVAGEVSGTEEDSDTEDSDEESESGSTEISGDGYEGNGDGTFTVRGVVMSISDSYDEDEIPSDFTALTITYQGIEVTAFQFDSGDVYLVYLEDESGGGDFYVLDTERDVVYSYIRLNGGDSYLILLLAPESEVIADAYEKTLVALNDADGITAYKYAQEEETLSTEISTGDYCYFYGISDEGVTGWYLFDSVNQTYIRATTDLSVDSDAAEETEDLQEDTESLEKMLIVVLAALCLLFFILMIIFGIRSRRARKFAPEDMHAPEEEDEYRKTRARRGSEEETEGRKAGMEKTEKEKSAGKKEVDTKSLQGDERGSSESLDEMERLLMSTLYGEHAGGGNDREKETSHSGNPEVPEGKTTASVPKGTDEIQQDAQAEPANRETAERTDAAKESPAWEERVEETSEKPENAAPGDREETSAFVQGGSEKTSVPEVEDALDDWDDDLEFLDL